MSTERENSFEEFVIRECKERNLTLGRLCEGLYSKDMVSKIKNKKRNIDILTKNRLLGRLGIPEDNFQKYLNKKEYGRWVERQKILIAMEKKDKTKAVDQIKQYREHGFENILEEQFCLVRIEQGITSPKSTIIKGLLQRLRLPSERSHARLTWKKRDGIQTYHEINVCMEKDGYEKLKDRASILKKLCEFYQEERNSYNPYGCMEEYIRASKLMAEEYRRSGRMEEAEQLDYCLQVECLKNRVCFWSDVNAPHKLLRL